MRSLGMMLLLALLIVSVSSSGWAVPCVQCKTEMAPEAKFCMNCGSAVKAKPVNQRYDGIFPVVLYGAPFAPLGMDQNSEEAKAWQSQFLRTIKDIGFNAIGGGLTPHIIMEAEKLGMYAVPLAQYNKLLSDPGLTVEQANQAVARAAQLCANHRNVIAVIMYSDPAKLEWVQPWRTLGTAWNKLAPDVPLLMAYRTAASGKSSTMPLRWLPPTG